MTRSCNRDLAISLNIGLASPPNNFTPDQIKPAFPAVPRMLPVLRYVPDGLEVRRELWALTDRLDWLSLWWNHGFRNVYRQIAPGLETTGWAVTTAYCGALAAICWLRARHAELRGSLRDLALWVVAFSTCAIEVMLGSSPQSLIYNQVLVMPGMLIVMILAPVFARACALPNWSLHVLGVLNVAATFCVFKARWPKLDYLSLSGIGMILFLLTLGGAMVGGWGHSRRLVTPEG